MEAVCAFKVLKRSRQVSDQGCGLLGRQCALKMPLIFRSMVVRGLSPQRHRHKSLGAHRGNADLSKKGQRTLKM